MFHHLREFARFHSLPPGLGPDFFVSLAVLATLDYLHHRWSPLILVPFLLSAAAASDIDSSAAQKDSALVISASGQVSTNKNGQDWAIGQAERIGITKPIITGQDGYARFAVAGGTDFEVFANSLVTFRENVGNPQDLLDITTGRVRIQLHISADQPSQYRVITPVAVITARSGAAFTLAVDDEDDSTRVDVEQGEIFVQHALLPRGSPEIIKAGDAIAVEADEPLISRRLDRGALYRYAFHSIVKTLGLAIPGLGKNLACEAAPQQMVARNRMALRPH
jgi:hypothetical protein